MKRLIRPEARHLSPAQKWVLTHTDDVIAICEIMEGFYGVKKAPDGSWDGDKRKSLIDRAKLNHSLESLKTRGLVRYVCPKRRNITAVILTDLGKELRLYLLKKEGR